MNMEEKNYDYEKTLRLIEMLKVTDELEEKVIKSLRDIVKDFPIKDINKISDEETRNLVIKAYAEIGEYDMRKQSR